MARVRWNQARTENAVFAKIRRNARAAAAEMRDEIKSQVSGGGGRPSSPGRPPNRRSGNLRRYVRGGIRARKFQKEVIAKAGTLAKKAFYGLILEKGRRASSIATHMAPRPFINTSRTRQAQKRAAEILVRGR